MRNLALSIALLAAALPAAAQTPKELLDAYAAEARNDNPAFVGASAERGRAFFTRVQGKDWSCASCHTSTPSAGGKHAVTGKAIAPLAPAANPERFASAYKAEKWFRRNCNDVLGRECSAGEKGDVLAWLLAVR
jgi:cytochrome c peroxidase